MHQLQKSEPELAPSAPEPSESSARPVTSAHTGGTSSGTVDATAAAASDPPLPAAATKVEKGRWWWPAKGKWAEDWPLWGALAAIVASITGVLIFNSSPVTLLFIMIAGNSIAQMFIDFLAGPRKPGFSALARAIPLLAGFLALSVSKL